MVQDTGPEVHDSHHDSDEDDERNKIRRVGNDLDEFFEPLVLDFVDRQREEDRDREPDEKGINPQPERVPDNPEAGRGAEELPEVHQSDKIRTEDSFSGAESLER